MMSESLYSAMSHEPYPVLSAMNIKQLAAYNVSFQVITVLGSYCALPSIMSHHKAISFISVAKCQLAANHQVVFQGQEYLYHCLVQEIHWLIKTRLHSLFFKKTTCGDVQIKFKIESMVVLTVKE